MQEYNFDGLVGPSHNYGGLSFGNVASQSHSGQVSKPKLAAHEGLAKMRFVSALGVGQGVLPPQMRPSLAVLRKLGFAGKDSEVIAQAATEHEQLLRLCSSASSMWTANAATVAPSADTADGRLHLTPANLTAMFHRAIEAETTTRVLRAIFADEKRFAVHDPLPGADHFGDEGAANHTRLYGSGKAVHLFAFGRTSYLPAPGEGPKKFPARQTLEASQAVARLHQLDRNQVLFARQNPSGIDGGAFHTDVLAVGNGNVLLLHELAFSAAKSILKELQRLVGDEFKAVIATEAELPIADAVKAYPFNSQLVTLPNGRMAIIAPKDAEENPNAHAFLSRVRSEGVVENVHYLDVRQSMRNGGGPACLRQRVSMTPAEVAAIGANVLYTPSLHASLTTWVDKHYRDEIAPDDVRDPLLAEENMAALDELTQILKLGSVYEFQL